MLCAPWEVLLVVESVILHSRITPLRNYSLLGDDVTDVA